MTAHSVAHPARARLIGALEQLLALLESDVRTVAGTCFSSPQQPIAELSPILWRIRRGNFSNLLYMWLLLAPGGLICALAKNNGWIAKYESLLAQVESSFRSLYCIRYFRTESPVELGDRVAVRGLFQTKLGRVSYVSGRPRHSSELDFGGICRVGVSMQSGTFTAIHVDPHSLELGKSVTLLSRDVDAVPAMPSEQELRD